MKKRQWTNPLLSMFASTVMCTILSFNQPSVPADGNLNSPFILTNPTEPITQRLESVHTSLSYAGKPIYAVSISTHIKDHQFIHSKKGCGKPLKNRAHIHKQAKVALSERFSPFHNFQAKHGQSIPPYPSL